METFGIGNHVALSTPSHVKKDFNKKFYFNPKIKWKIDIVNEFIYCAIYGGRQMTNWNKRWCNKDKNV